MQCKVLLTNRQYRLSEFYYMLLQEDASRKETVKGKFDSEQYARQVRVNIEHYHVNNERFADYASKHHEKYQGQMITYSRVNA